MVNFDVLHFFRVFKGPAGVLELLNRYQPGHGLSYNAIQMWHRRAVIPGRWTGAVLYCLDREGHSFLQFLIDDEELGDARSGC